MLVIIVYLYEMHGDYYPGTKARTNVILEQVSKINGA
jgi:hypothetical protein